MILDLNSLLSGSLNSSGGIDGQAITASAASTNSYDLGAAGTIPYGGSSIIRNIGKAGEIPLLIQVTEAFNNLTSLTIAVQVDDNSSFSSATTVASQTIALADLTVGKISVIDKLPRGINERYLRLYYTVTGAAPAAGKIVAGIVGSVDGSY